MANEEHLAILRQGVEAWNHWREAHPEIQPDLSDADLRGANLINANLSNVHLRGANLSQAQMQGTILTSLDLRSVTGLETVQHQGPSPLGLQTIYQSHGDIPAVFLRGAGFALSDHLMRSVRSWVSRPICFLSYSSTAHRLAERLHADLQSNGVSCEFAAHPMKAEQEAIRRPIDPSIRSQDQLLLVLSRDSVTSQWIEQEVEQTLERERKEHRVVLFPIHIYPAVMNSEMSWLSRIRSTRTISNFTAWKDRDAYQQAFTRLLRDLHGN